MHAKVGIAGLDANRRLTQLNQAGFGISGVDRLEKAQIANEQVGYLGGEPFKRRDENLTRLTKNSGRLGDRAAAHSWTKGVWFSDFTYLCSPFAGDNERGMMAWRDGRQAVFGKTIRTLPLFIDSCGYRREITGTAPVWARQFNRYLEAIELLQPDAFAAWDYPSERQLTIKYLTEIENIYPYSEKLWPVFSIRWAWRDDAHLSFSRLPGWRSDDLSYLVPLNRTQKKFSYRTRDGWARVAIANALSLAKDEDFLYMVNRYGKVMIGGMVGGPCPRASRHIFAATLCHLFPSIQFWLLGQANFMTINGLGRMGILNQVWTDGTWWIKDATCERFSVVEDGLITMISLESNRRIQSFFTIVELMAANLRSLLAAYEGLWVWPPPEPLPIDLIDEGQRVEMKSRLQATQLELFGGAL